MLQEVIDKMSLCEIQETFCVSRLSAIRIKKGMPVKVDLQKAINFFSNRALLKLREEMAAPLIAQPNDAELIADRLIQKIEQSLLT